MNKIVYLDNNATTPIHPEVKKTLIEAIDYYGNPSSMHQAGRVVSEAISNSRNIIAKFINADSKEILFTGSGSEANNTVIHNIFSNCLNLAGCKIHVITSAIEHPSVLETLEHYAKSGIEVTYLPVDKFGMVSINDVEKAIRPNTKLISIMFANNEVGTIQPIKEIAKIAKKHKILMHTDAVQATGKIPIDVKDLGVDFLTISGHKIYAPKGIGVLYVSENNKLFPLIYGGHQENKLRAGTENTLGIIALGRAVELLSVEMEDEVRKSKRLKEKLKQGFLDKVSDISINGHPEQSLSNTLNVTFDFVEGESILLYADLEGIAISTGSACSTGSLEPSHVIMAIESRPERAHGSVRFSIGRENTEADIDYVLKIFPPIIQKLRDISPLYNV